MSVLCEPPLGEPRAKRARPRGCTKSGFERSEKSARGVRTCACAGSSEHRKSGAAAGRAGSPARSNFSLVAVAPRLKIVRQCVRLLVAAAPRQVFNLKFRRPLLQLLIHLGSRSFCKAQKKNTRRARKIQRLAKKRK